MRSLRSDCIPDATAIFDAYEDMRCISGGRNKQLCASHLPSIRRGGHISPMEKVLEKHVRSHSSMERLPFLLNLH